MTRDDVKLMLRPHADSTQSVMDWLQRSEVAPTDVRDEGETIHFVTTLSNAEKMLDTTFNVYRNVHRHVDKIRTLHYSLPEELHRHIDMIQPTTRFGQMRAQRSQVIDVQRVGQPYSGLNVTACNATITPQCLKTLYNVGPPHRSPCGFVGINGFLEEYPRYDDFHTFAQEYAPYLRNQSFTWASVDGGLLNQSSTEDSVEANLDVQYALSVGFPVKGNYYSTAGRGILVPDLDQPNAENNENEPYLDFFDYILSLPDAELPHTCKWQVNISQRPTPS